MAAMRTQDNQGRKTSGISASSSMAPRRAYMWDTMSPHSRWHAVSSEQFCACYLPATSEVGMCWGILPDRSDWIG